MNHLSLISSEINPQKSISKNKNQGMDFLSCLILEVKRGNEVFTSSCVAISERIILTSAHSVEGCDVAYIVDGDTYNADNKKFKVEKIIIHEDYNKEQSFCENDIAILFLNDALPSSITIAELLPMQEHNVFNAFVCVGFGGRNGKNQRHLRFVSHGEFVNENKIIKLYDDSSVLGDSGGGVFLMGEKVYLMGIHSTKDNHKTYSVNINQYYKWMWQVLGENRLPYRNKFLMM